MLFTREVPWYCKALVVAAVAYAVFPFDLIWDIPILGWGDDVAVVLGLLSLALSLIPKGVLKNNPMEKPTVEPVAPGAAGAGAAGAAETGRRNVVVVSESPAVEVVEEAGTRGR